MSNQTVEIIESAKRTASSSDPQTLGVFRSKLAEYLNIEQSCPPELFEEILGIVGSPKLTPYSEYGSLLGDLAISEFALPQLKRHPLLKPWRKGSFNWVSRSFEWRLATFSSRFNPGRWLLSNYFDFWIDPEKWVVLKLKSFGNWLR